MNPGIRKIERNGNFAFLDLQIMVFFASILIYQFRAKFWLFVVREIHRGTKFRPL